MISKRFGLVGKTLKHSFSKGYFTKKFEELALSNYSYENFEFENLESLQSFLKNEALSLQGFNVTIPYKEVIIPFLDEVDEMALEIGAVNAVAIVEKKLIGYNTDYYGFLISIQPFLKVNHQKALILGTGGASKAVAQVFKTLKIPFTFVSRKENNSKYLTYQSLNQVIIESHQIIVNASPVGMFPNVEDCPDIPYEYLSSNHLVYDLVYNPAETLFLKNAKNCGAMTSNGLKMLEFQAEKAWEIWNRKATN